MNTDMPTTMPPTSRKSLRYICVHLCSSVALDLKFAVRLLRRSPGFAAISTAALALVLGVNAALGRTFTPDEDQRNHNNFVVLSDRLWRRRFGANPGVLNQVVRFNGNPFVVVGVMPPGFSILDKDVEVWMPAGF